MSTIIVTTAPTAEPLTLAEAADFCHVTTGDEDDRFVPLITEAREWAEEQTQRALMYQARALIADGWPDGGYFRIHCNLLAVTAVKFYDTTNAVATWDAANYFVDTDSTPNRLALAYSCIWPATTLRPVNGVRVEFTAGYSAATDALGVAIPEHTQRAAVPQPIKDTMLRRIRWRLDHRDASDEMQASRSGAFMIPAEVEKALCAELTNYRIWRF